MSIQLPDEVLNQLDHSALPVRLEDPRSHVEYVLIKKQEYDLLRESEDYSATLPDGAEEASDKWNETLNARRVELVKRQVYGKLTPDETVELEQLQEQMLAYRRRVAPLPLDELRELHQKLLNQAAQHQRGN
jgi:hypothetical protein